MSAIAAVGETSLIDEAMPTGTVRATTFCEVTALTVVDFNAVTEHVPTLRYFLQLYVRQRDAAAVDEEQRLATRKRCSACSFSPKRDSVTKETSASPP